ncbi:hypothetical protein [Bacillus sp. T3]|uniref:hypothetical protein n=1 Tax=Bacillus sp. T3 TaxID=467262 RepID=UPI0029828263|nr:hypothetical protein [Bacillus sp. T3]
MDDILSVALANLSVVFGFLSVAFRFLSVAFANLSVNVEYVTRRFTSIPLP